MTPFAKHIGCPTAATISAYSAGTLSFLSRSSIAEHLAACEFCGAESALLSRQAHVADEMLEPHVAAPPLPFALRLLAESMLGEMHAAQAAVERRAA